MDFDAGFDARFGGTGVGFGEHDAAADALARVALDIGTDTRLVALVTREPTLAPGNGAVASFAATATRAVPESGTCRRTNGPPVDEAAAWSECRGRERDHSDSSEPEPGSSWPMRSRCSAAKSRSREMSPRWKSFASASGLPPLAAESVSPLSRWRSRMKRS